MKGVPKKALKRWRILVVLVVIALGVYFGRALLAPHPSIAAAEDVEVAEDADVIWTCSMHPEVRQPEPGLCPICEMNLIPVEADDLDLGERQVAVTTEAEALAELQVMPAVRKPITRSVRLFGEVDYDETLLRRVSSDVRGRIERLHIAYTGSRVRKGDPMFDLYSPKLISAQEELLQAVKTLRGVEDNGGRRSVAAESSVEGARQRLRWWGVTDEQIAELETTGDIIDRLTIKSPADGTVVHRLKDDGEYVNEGEPVYRIADLSRLWVQLEAYESDLAWVHYGQKISFTAQESLPGEKFEGIIVFVDPVLDRSRRTVKLRANVENPEGRLRPGMFVRGVLESQLTADGRSEKPRWLAGKWISPLRPEIIADEPGSCPISGVDLERAEDLGYIDEEPENGLDPLLIPASAPLITGERAVLYVRVTDHDLDLDDGRTLYEGREITLGPRAGGYYSVLDGLEEGELVVVKGNFKLDSELQLDARPSMMSPPDEEEVKEPVWDVDEAFLEQISPIISAYLEIVRALADDDFEGAVGPVETALETLDGIDTELLDDVAGSAWEGTADRLEHALHQLHHADEIEEARAAFEEVTAALDSILEQFGLPPGITLYRLNCPMAFDNEGADWLFDAEEVLNPYFGAMMLRCGEVKEKLQ